MGEVAAEREEAGEPTAPRGSSTSVMFRSGTTAAATLVGQMVTGLGLILLARAEAPAVFGKFSAVLAFSALAGLALDFGSSQLITRDLAVNSFEGDVRAWIARRTALQVTALPFLLVVALVWFGRGLPAACTVVLCAQAVTSSLALGASAPLRAAGQTTRAAVNVALGNCLFLAAVIVGRSFPDHAVLIAAIGQSASWVVTGFASFWWWNGRLPRVRGRNSVGNPWRSSGAFGLLSVGAALASVDVTVANAVGSSDAAGQYAAVSRWTQPLGLISNAYSQVLFPEVAKASTGRRAVAVLRTAIPGGFIAAFVAAVIAVIATPLVRLVLGRDYADAAHALRFLCLAVAVAMVNQLLAMTLQARKRERFAALSVTGSSIVYLPLVAAMSRPLGAVAAPVAFCIAQSLLLILLVTEVRKLAAE